MCLYFTPTVKFDGCFSKAGTRQTFHCGGHLLPSALTMFPNSEDWFFQQDMLHATRPGQSRCARAPQSSNVHYRPQFPTLFTDVFPIDLNADVTLVTVPIETLAS